MRNQTPVDPGGGLNTALLANDDPGEAPVHSVLDIPVGRDTALLAKRLLRVIAGEDPRITLGTGHSGGAFVNLMLNAGVDPQRGATPMRVGDNRVRPYDLSSKKIYDGFISLARGGGPVIPIDAGLGVSVPTIFIEGEVDVGSRLAVQQLDEMIGKGVDANKKTRIYMVRNVPHIDAGLVSAIVTQGRDFAGLLGLPEQFYEGRGERLKPLTAASLDALHRWVSHGKAPSASIFPGVAEDTDAVPGVDTLRFAQAGGTSSLSYPYVDNPSFDAIFAPPPASTQNNVPLAETWLRVRDALNAGTGSVVLPEIACRRGASTFISSGPVGAWFTPFDQATFLSSWGSSAAHQTCKVEAIAQLGREKLYDKDVVAIDIEPDDFPNVIDLDAPGLLPVAILSTSRFDATRIRVKSLRLAGANAQGKDCKAAPRKSYRRDVNADGRKDVVVLFHTSKLELSGENVAELWGETIDRQPFVGSDLIDVVGDR